MVKPDFIAELKYRTTEEGGRRSFAASGYRPHIEFDDYPEYLTSGSQKFLNKEKVYPGDFVSAQINILGIEYFSKRLYVGKCFKFCEGARIIGYGSIVQIINEDLEIEYNQYEEQFNVNLFPNDIIEEIVNGFGDDFGKAVRIIQPFLINNKELRTPRIVRSLVYLSNFKVDELVEQINVAKIDYRDTLFAAEYENRKSDRPIRSRNFNNEFGNEKI